MHYFCDIKFKLKDMKIKHNELRYGNLISLTELARTDIFDTNEVVFKNNFHLVTGIFQTELNLYIEGFAECEFNYIDVEPIPLTEEWLLKFGFEKTPMGYTKNISLFEEHEYKHLFVDLDQGISIRQGSLSKPRHKDDLVSIYNTDKQGEIYVHTLQNIFYFNSGFQELKIK